MASVEEPQPSRGLKQTGSLERLSWKLRALSLFAGLLVLSLLITARTLKPSPTGLGTHQQLGLPPCTSIALFQAPCPACGMTTSWALLLRGSLWGAFEANAGGALLAIIGLAYVPASCYFFWVGIASRREWFSLSLAMALLLALAIATIQWLFRL